MFSGTLAKNAPMWIGDSGSIAPGVQAPVKNVAPGAQPAPRPSRLSQLGPMLLAFSGNPLGGFLLRQRAEQDQFEQQQQLAEQQRQQALADARQTWLQQQQWQRENPAPTEIERNVAYFRSIGRNDLADLYIQNRANPVQGVPYTDAQGNQGIQFIRPGQPGAGQAPRPLTDDDIDRLSNGGPSQPATGGFR